MRDIHLEKAFAIDGWMSLNELTFLARIARVSNLMLEVGCYKGRSTRALCDNTKGWVVACDPWDGPYINDNGQVLFDQAKSYPEFRRNLVGITNLITFRGNFEEFAKECCVREFDFIFLDGDHRYESVLKDIELSLKLLKSGGLLAGHDYGRNDWPGVKQAVDECFEKKEIVETIWATLKF